MSSSRGLVVTLPLYDYAIATQRGETCAAADNITLLDCLRTRVGLTWIPLMAWAVLKSLVWRSGELLVRSSDSRIM